ncbi:hypothetical protein D3C87_571910 [compost metagenome]
MKKILLTLSTLLMAGLAHAQSTGTLQVSGEAGRFQIFQKVKAVRCDSIRRGECDAAIFFDLNKPQAVAPGSYIVGFENSIYPGFVKVDAGRTTDLYLEKVTVPAKVKGTKIRVYRDMGQAIEQNKILFSMYTMGRHFFRLDKDNFGDLYLTGTWERDFVQRLTYETCSRISAYREVPETAKAVCDTWNGAASYADLGSIYKFNSDGTIVEAWVTYPGDVINTKHPRYLVGAPMSADDFVAVFPGAYKVQAEGKNTPAVQVRAGSSTESYY